MTKSLIQVINRKHFSIKNFPYRCESFYFVTLLEQQSLELGRNLILKTELNEHCYHSLDSLDDRGSSARIKTVFFQLYVPLQV